jgi:hypothetical protein
MDDAPWHGNATFALINSNYTVQCRSSFSAKILFLPLFHFRSQLRICRSYIGAADKRRQPLLRFQVLLKSKEPLFLLAFL